MASTTGAPWSLPFPEASDLVVDGAAAIEALAVAVATGLSAAGNAGIGSNVVQTVKTDIFSASLTVGTSTAITGLSLSITPSTDTSKILVIAEVNTAGQSAGSGAGIILKRGATELSIGDADGVRRRVSSAGTQAATHAFNNIFVMFLDSPATTAATTYSVDIVNGTSGTVTLLVNRNQNNSNNVHELRTASRITAIEVAA